MNDKREGGVLIRYLLCNIYILSDLIHSKYGVCIRYNTQITKSICCVLYNQIYSGGKFKIDDVARKHEHGALIPRLAKCYTDIPIL